MLSLSLQPDHEKAPGKEGQEKAGRKGDRCGQSNAKCKKEVEDCSEEPGQQETENNDSEDDKMDALEKSTQTKQSSM